MIQPGNHGEDPNPQGYAADEAERLLRGALGLDREYAKSPFRQDPVTETMGRAIGMGVRKVAEGLVDPDLTTRANAVRTTKGLIDIADDGGKETPKDSLEAFQHTTFSPEEMRMGLAQIAATLPGQAGDLVRKELSVSKRQPEAGSEEVSFDENEAPLVAAFTWLGVSASKQAEASNKLIKPKSVWESVTGFSDAQVAEMVNAGFITGNPEEAREFMAKTYRKFSKGLKKAIETNEADLRALRRSVSGSSK